MAVDPTAYMAPRIEAVNAYIKERLAVGHHPKVVEAIAYYPSTGGKRLRPVLAMAAADAVLDGTGERAMPYGCVLELVHNFTLVHDDIMDGDALRRGRPTLHTVFGEPAAINAGDVLFALAFEVLSDTRVDGETLRTLVRETARTVFEIGEGQQWDMDFEKVDPASGRHIRDVLAKLSDPVRASLRRGCGPSGARSEPQCGGDDRQRSQELHPEPPVFVHVHCVCQHY